MLTVSVSCLSVCINVTQNVVNEFRHFLDQWCFYAVYNLALIIRLKESALKHHVKGHWEPAFPHWGMVHCAPSEPFLGPHHVHMLRICPASE